MRIAVDAMGGDNAPAAVVEGAVLAACEYEIEILLVGQQEAVDEQLRKLDVGKGKIKVVPASQVVLMDESAAEAIRRKKDSSLAVSARLLKNGEADAMISAGNTGAALATTRALLGKLEGVSRPAIATIIPNPVGATILLDAGANAGSCRPEHLLQFAVMGEIYAKAVMNMDDPRVGLLSVGEEKTKGSAITLAAYPMMEASITNFIGNVEGKDIVNGAADVVVCDGFVGNVVLKLIEGVAETLYNSIREEIDRSILAKVGMLLAGSALQKFKHRLDYEEHGGAPLLGVNGVCLISHGKSSANAIKSAIRIASDFVAQGVNKRIEDDLRKTKQGKKA